MASSSGERLRGLGTVEHGRRGRVARSRPPALHPHRPRKQSQPRLGPAGNNQQRPARASVAARPTAAQALLYDMADALPPNSDPDFPDQPELAAALHEQLNRLVAALPADFWDVLRPMTRLARLLHRQLWLLPPSGLLRELTELTGLGKAQARRLIDLADKRAYLRELVLRGPALFSYIVVAQHLLDGPLGTYTLEAAPAAGRGRALAGRLRAAAGPLAAQPGRAAGRAERRFRGPPRRPAPA